MEGQDENRMSPEHQFFRAFENSSFGAFDIDFEQRWIGQRLFFKKLIEANGLHFEVTRLRRNSPGKIAVALGKSQRACDVGECAVAQRDVSHAIQ